MPGLLVFRVFAIKIIDLDAEMFAKKTMVILVFKIDSGEIHTAIALINWDKMVLFQIVVLISEIWCFRTVVFFLVFCLVDVVTKEQYP